ncbi:EF-hand domain-containing protein [Solimonas variicoloris]|uniref:EF-hand domain-containing protein n=1 Tax=Solimonas variicoloris TaxID=254408 RepID=UPI00146AD550|nr:EF-hand domain-containing protein [Solimonas variicoloris]
MEPEDEDDQPAVRGHDADARSAARNRADGDRGIRRRAGSASGHSPSPGDAAATVASDPFVRMDQDGDGYISRAEATGRVRSTWSKFDADGDGRVSQSEYARGAN